MATRLFKKLLQDMGLSKPAVPKVLPEDSIELEELRDELTALIRKFRELIAITGKCIEYLRMVQSVESSDDDNASRILPTLKELFEEYRELARLQSRPQEMPRVRRGVENYFSETDRKEHVRLGGLAFEKLDELIDLGDEFEMARFFQSDAMKSLMEKSLTAFALSIELLRYRKGEIAEPPEIPSELTDLVFRSLGPSILD